MECDSRITTMPEDANATPTAHALADEARSLTRRGYYNDAIDRLQKAQSYSPDDLYILCELAEVHATQGYINRAHELCSSREFSESDPYGDVLQMMKCFFEPLISGRFAIHVNSAERLNDRYSGIGPTHPNWMQAASVRLYYFKFIGLSSVFHHTVYQSRLEKAQNDLDNAVDCFIGLQDLGAAFQFANVLLDKQNKVERLGQIARHENATDIIRAKASVELAQELQAPEQKEVRRELREFARPIMQQQHHRGTLDIDIAQFIENVGDIDATRGLDIDDLLQQYRHLDFPNGSKSWLHKILDLATQLHNYDLQHACEEELKELSSKTGTLLLSIISKVNHIARFHQKTGNEDLIKTTLLKLYKELEAFDVPFTKGHVGFILADIYVRYKDPQEAVQWATVCSRHWSSCPPSVSSQGKLQLLRAQILAFETEQCRDYERIRAVCDKYVESDMTDNLLVEATIKLEMLVGLLHTCASIPPRDKMFWSLNLLNRIQSILDSVTDSDVRLQKAGFMQQRATLLLSIAKRRSDCVKEMEALGVLEEALALTVVASSQALTYQLIVIREQMSLVSRACFEKLQHSEPELSRDHLHNAETGFSECRRAYETISATFQVAETSYWIAVVKYDARKKGWTTSADVSEALLAAEQGYDARRNEISISSGLSAIKDKQTLAKEKHVRDLYRMAFQLCVSDNDTVGAWQWVQKAKARSLSDTLGLGCLVPEVLIRSILDDPPARKLYEEEQDLSQQLRISASDNKFSSVLKLRDVQERMLLFPSLKSLLDLRQGRAVSAHDLVGRLRDLSQSADIGEVAFVDWYVGHDDTLYVLILQPGLDPVVQNIGITSVSIRAWLDTYLHSSEGQADFLGRADNHPNQALRAMDCLVEAVGRHVEDNVLLVLSTTAPMDELPLHALYVQPAPTSGRGRRGRPKLLIERNPLIYCSNLTAFIQCCERATTKMSTLATRESFVGVYEGTDIEACDETERTLVYDSMRATANSHEALCTTGFDVTNQSLRESLSTTDHVLFHGHCNLAPSDVSEQSLILARRNSNIQPQGFSYLTVKQIFDLKIRASLVSLLACGSSTQKIDQGDEPLGLVTALLCAGVASVVGTLWPISSANARQFTQIFCGELRQMRLNGSARNSKDGLTVSTTINLAVAVQKTVLRLRSLDGTRKPYCWAAFVLHGTSLMNWVSKVNVQR